MRTALLISIISSAFLHFGTVQAASVVNSHNKQGNTTGITAIVGITQESSWACEGDPAVLCRCAANLLKGKVANVDYRAGSAIPEGFVLETVGGAVYVGLPDNWEEDLGTADMSWVPRLIKRNEALLVAVEACGMGGSNIIARDIYGKQMFGVLER